MMQNPGFPNMESPVFLCVDFSGGNHAENSRQILLNICIASGYIIC